MSLWRQKLVFLQKEEVVARGGEKFAVAKEIEEAKRKIAELEAEARDEDDSTLLERWRSRVARDHSTLVGYFQSQAGFDLLDPIYVLLDLAPEVHPLERRAEEHKTARPRSLREYLDLDPQEHR